MSNKNIKAVKAEAHPIVFGLTRKERPKDGLLAEVQHLPRRSVGPTCLARLRLHYMNIRLLWTLELLASVTRSMHHSQKLQADEATS